MYMLLWFMIVAHCLSDMCWQSSFVSGRKGQKLVILFFHALCVTGAISIPMYILSDPLEYMLPISIVYLIFTHVVVDHWKSNSPRDDEHFYYIYIDQLLHLMCIIIAWMMIL